MELLNVRLLTKDDIPFIVEYWNTRTDENLLLMGVQPEIARSIDFGKLISEQFELPNHEKKVFFVIWEVNGKPIGHSNASHIEFGSNCHMHLHIWQPDTRQRGMGTELVKRSLPIYFKELQLERIFCTPHAINPAPNKTLRRVGFDLIQENHVCVPGFLNFEQPVNRYEMTLEKFAQLSSK